MKAFLTRQWFLLALILVLALGCLAPDALAPLRAGWIHTANVVIVLFVTSLPLEARMVARTISRPTASLLATAVNMAILPLLAYVFSPLLAGELKTGLIVAACVPCTQASAAVWTRRAGGNDAAALLVTIITNATCFLITPAWLLWLTQTELQLQADAMVQKLALQVALPMVVGQLVRLIPGVAARATAARVICANIAQAGILLMVLIGASQCGDRLQSQQGLVQQAISPLGVTWLLTVVSALHLTAWFIGSALARLARLSDADSIAVSVAGSQKTLMIGLKIAIDYFGGLAILPMVAYHVMQLILDTILVDRFRERMARQKHCDRAMNDELR